VKNFQENILNYICHIQLTPYSYKLQLLTENRKILLNFSNHFFVRNLFFLDNKLYLKVTHILYLLFEIKSFQGYLLLSLLTLAFFLHSLHYKLILCILFYHINISNHCSENISKVGLCIPKSITVYSFF